MAIPRLVWACRATHASNDAHGHPPLAALPPPLSNITGSVAAASSAASSSWLKSDIAQRLMLHLRVLLLSFARATLCMVVPLSTVARATLARACLAPANPCQPQTRSRLMMRRWGTMGACIGRRGAW